MQNFQDHTIMMHRLKHIIWIFFLGSALGMLITWFGGQKTHLLESISATALLCGMLFVGIIISVYRQGKYRVAGMLLIFTMTIVITVTTWAAGGLNSIGLITFPVILLSATAYATARYFYPLFLTLFLITLFFGFNGVFDWFPAPEGNFVTGFARLLGFLLCFILCGVLVWLISKDLSYALTALENEKSEMTHSNKKIQHLADHDALTGLLSYAAAKNHYLTMQQSFSEGKEMIVFYFIDLDDFKLINDVYDHSAGDELLISIGQRLTSIVNDEGVVCRIGGDEFVLFKVVKQDFDKHAFSEQLLKQISSNTYEIKMATLKISASVGVSFVKDKKIGFEDVRKKADMAMIKAKQSGKNSYHRYSETLELEYMSNLMMIQGLKTAVSTDVLDLNFQAKLCLLNNRVIGAGVTINWIKNNPRNYQYDDFLPVIASTELIHEIGEWTILEACKTCKQWEKEGHNIKVFVHILAVQLARPTFSNRVKKILSMVGLSPEKLVFSMSEDAFYIEETASTEQQVKQLKAIGVKLSISGFGSGYSNLSQLTELEIDGMCLDESLVSDVCISDNTKVVVSAIVNVATELKMIVGVAGIKSNVQATALIEAGCLIGEGDYWSQPVSSNEFLSFVSTKNNIT